MFQCKKIGGEFEINPFVLSELAGFIPPKHIRLFSNGRSALIAILNHLRDREKNVIFLPYYICYSVVEACSYANFSVRFYELNEHFHFPIDFLGNIKKGEILLTVNYFGFVDDNPVIKTIKQKRPDITIISDHVQSYWTYEKSVADFSFTSLRKHFAIPEGALVHARDSKFQFDTNLPESSFYKNKLIGSLLKYMHLPDNVYLMFFEQGEYELDHEQMPCKASLLAYFTYEKLKIEDIKKIRKENYEFVYNIGQYYGLDFVFPYNESIIPLNIPIYLKNRNKIRKILMENNIFLPIHWMQSYYNKHSALAKMLGSNELSLIIDQRYSVEDIKIEIELLINATKNG